MGADGGIAACDPLVPTGAAGGIAACDPLLLPTGPLAGIAVEPLLVPTGGLAGIAVEPLVVPLAGPGIAVDGRVPTGPLCVPSGRLDTGMLSTIEPLRSAIGMAPLALAFSGGGVPPMTPLRITVPVSVGPLFMSSEDDASARGPAVPGRGGALGGLVRGAVIVGTGVFDSRIASSRSLRAADPGGGGGTVFALRRVAGGGSGSGAGSGSLSTFHPDARSAMRPFVASPRRRRVRSSSGTSRP
jgi:hypothetical protein